MDPMIKPDTINDPHRWYLILLVDGSIVSNQIKDLVREFLTLHATESKKAGTLSNGEAEIINISELPGIISNLNTLPEYDQNLFKRIIDNSTEAFPKLFLFDSNPNQVNNFTLIEGDLPIADYKKFLDKFLKKYKRKGWLIPIFIGAAIWYYFS